MSIPNFSSFISGAPTTAGAGIQPTGDGLNALIGSTSGTETGHPGIISTGTAVEGDTTTQTGKAVSEIEAEKQHAADQFGAFKQAQFDTPGTDLYEHQNVNFAEGDEGPYARGNRRTYDQTLELSRQADAYNNKPIEKTRRVIDGGVGQVANVSWETPYDRPKIETEEMREMQKSRQLDLNQKQLAQQLQAAVNQKNLDAFRYYWQQMYGITITAFEAEQQMRVFNRQQQIYNTITKDKASFDRYLKLHFDQVTANVIYKVSLKNPAVGMYLAPLSMGYPMADLDTTVERILDQSIFNECVNMFPGDPSRARQAWYETKRSIGLDQAKNETGAIKRNTER